MDLYVTPDVQAKLDLLASATGQTQHALANELLSAQLDGLLETGATLDSRYDDMLSGRVQPIDGRTALRALRARIKARRTSA